MEILKQFYENKALMEAVKTSQLDSMREEALENLLKGKDATHLADSLKAIEAWYSGLRDIFEPKKKPLIKSSR